MPHRLTPARSLALAFLFLLLLRVPAARAQGSAMDLIAAVNALRASYGLPPYAVDSGLMAYSQSHSNYQASIELATHLHKDGTNPNSGGTLRENVATTTGVDINYVVSTIWSDEIHMITMVGYQTGAIGAGIATGQDGDTYYTIDVRLGSPASVAPPKSGTGGQPGAALTPFATQPPIEPIQTATTRPNGFLVHVVGYGQTLWDISRAYGVNIDDLRAINSISSDNMVQSGWKLIIRAPLPSTATAAVKTMTALPKATQTSDGAPAATAQPATATPTYLPPTATPQPSDTPRPTLAPPSPTPTRTPFLGGTLANLKTLGIGLIVVCGIGLVVLFVTGVRKM